MKYCSECGAPVRLKVPAGDNLPRYVCERCQTIHYQNPKLVVGCIPERGSEVLLCRRAINPRYGLWTLPAGFMENGETTAAAAAREAREEANADVNIGELFSLFNLPHVNQVYLIFHGQLLNSDYAPGTESLEVKLFREADIPWNELAFPAIQRTLRYYYQDRRTGRLAFHLGDITASTDPGPWSG